MCDIGVETRKAIIYGDGSVSEKADYLALNLNGRYDQIKNKLIKSGFNIQEREELVIPMIGDSDKLSLEKEFGISLFKLINPGMKEAS